MSTNEIDVRSLIKNVIDHNVCDKKLYAKDKSKLEQKYKDDEQYQVFKILLKKYIELGSIHSYNDMTLALCENNTKWVCGYSEYTKLIKNQVIEYIGLINVITTPIDLLCYILKELRDTKQNVFIPINPPPSELDESVKKSIKRCEPTFASIVSKNKTFNKVKYYNKVFNLFQSYIVDIDKVLYPKLKNITDKLNNELNEDIEDTSDEQLQNIIVEEAEIQMDPDSIKGGKSHHRKKSKSRSKSRSKSGGKSRKRSKSRGKSKRK